MPIFLPRNDMLARQPTLEGKLSLRPHSPVPVTEGQLLTRGSCASHG